MFNLCNYVIVGMPHPVTSICVAITKTTNVAWRCGNLRLPVGDQQETMIFVGSQFGELIVDPKGSKLPFHGVLKCLDGWSCPDHSKAIAIRVIWTCLCLTMAVKQFETMRDEQRGPTKKRRIPKECQHFSSDHPRWMALSQIPSWCFVYQQPGVNETSLLWQAVGLLGVASGIS